MKNKNITNYHYQKQEYLSCHQMSPDTKTKSRYLLVKGKHK